MKYRLIISDYDGTLGCAPNNDVDKSTREAIEKFTEKGGIFAVCTGRETSSIMNIVRGQNLKGVVASFQGARITEIESGKVLFNGGLTAQGALKAFNEVEPYKLTALAYGDGALFAEQRTPMLEVYERAVGLTAKITDIREEIERQSSNISKICWLGDEKIVGEAERALNAKFKGEGLKFNCGVKFLLEVINPKHGKGHAVRYIADYYNIPLSEVMTVGDSTNDIDLLVGEWHGVCVGDGREELKAVADEITVPFKDKPIKTLIEKYCL